MKRKEVIALIKKENPDIIGIELCKIREYIYLNKIEAKPHQEDKSIIGKISKAIKDKAKKENLEYGLDMYSALDYARENKIPYVLVDENIQKIQQLLQNIPQNESKKFIEEINKFEKQTIAESTIDEDKFLEELNKNFPIIFTLMITLRELKIANNILKIQQENQNKKIVIVLGKGHLKGVEKLI